MALLGLELSDAGIFVAGGTPATLLKIDGQKQESPGFALPENKGLLVGNAAADRARLFPLQVMNRFWDQLNTEPLKQKSEYAQNHAEIACAHLSYIWKNINMHGDEMIVAVPDYYGREQLGLILGMAQELSIPVKGFVSLPVAASWNPRSDAMLIHLDIHLHRFEIVYLHQGDRLTREISVSGQEVSLEQLYRSWVESIAQEFVHTTRFDPLHEASTEQEIYNRLPAALEMFRNHSSFIFELSREQHSYRITLLRDLLTQKSDALYDEICRLIARMRDEQGKRGYPIALQLTHRVACLPGLKDKLSVIDNCEIMELKPGAGAQGVLALWSQLPDGHSGHSTSFFTSRPWQQTEQRVSQTVPDKASGMIRPTHVLYRDVAYPLSDKPLLIGCDPSPAGKGISVQAQSSEVSKEHCTVHRDTDRIVLTDYSSQGTFVDGQRITGSTILSIGQTVRLGKSEETIRLISCMVSDET